MFPLYFDKLTENLPIRGHLFLENLDLNFNIAAAVRLWIIMWKNSFHRVIIRKKRPSCTIIRKITSAQPIGLHKNLYPSFKSKTISDNSKQLLVIQIGMN